MTRALALIAIVPAWFPFWRRHAAWTYAMLLGTLGGFAAAVVVLRDPVLSVAAELPAAVRVLGWILVAAAIVVGTIADRQLGFRVRAFVPFFEDGGRIELRTGGAYGVVRHPIYAAGAWFQLGVFFATGYAAVAAAAAVFLVGALWFTRQEERRLAGLLADPAAYDRYRARVPALFPRLWCHGPRGGRS